MRWSGHGHGAIRATHYKTLELVRDDSITQRATCVVAVGVDVVPPAPMAGPVSVTISAAGTSFSFEALANPNWAATSSAVIRRSPLRLPGTLATHATAAAKDLPRPLVLALANPATKVDVRLERRVGPPTVVLFAADPLRGDDPRLAAELDAADVVLAEDAVARELVGARAEGLTADSTTGRLLVVATGDLPGASIGNYDSPIETVGLSARLAVAAASPRRGALIVAPDDADPRRIIRRTQATDRLVLRVPADQLERVLVLAGQERGTSIATVAQEYAPPTVASRAAVPELTSRDDVFCCLHPATASDALDPAVRAAFATLLADGVSTRTASRALTELTGMPRRRSYDTVVAMAAESTADG